MQKKIIALAVASALTMPAMAYAEATVYGQVDMSINMVKDGNATSSSANQLVSNQSRVGVKGSEDLGGGMSAIWQMEAEVGMDTGATTTGQLFNRDTFLGISSSMGTVKLGNLDTPYKRSTRKLDVFADSNVADNRNLMGTHDVRNQNAIDYTSPSFGGFTLAVASVFGNETPSAAPNDKKGTAMSLAAMYEQGPIYATLAMDNLKSGNTTGGTLNFGAVDDKSTATKLGGGFATDVFTVNVVLEQLKDKVALSGQETKGTNMYVAGKFNVSSSDAVKLAYTSRGETKVAGTAQQNEASQIAFGYDHGMSKNTTVYALYTKVTDEGPVGAATTNPDPSALSFGIKHSF